MRSVGVAVVVPAALAGRRGHRRAADAGEVAAQAFEASLAVLLGIATATLAVLAFSWWIVPLLLIGAYAARRQWRSLRT